MFFSLSDRTHITDSYGISAATLQEKIKTFNKEQLDEFEMKLTQKNDSASSDMQEQRKRNTESATLSNNNLKRYEKLYSEYTNLDDEKKHYIQLAFRTFSDDDLNDNLFRHIRASNLTDEYIKKYTDNLNKFETEINKQKGIHSLKTSTRNTFTGLAPNKDVKILLQQKKELDDDSKTAESEITSSATQCSCT